MTDFPRKRTRCPEHLTEIVTGLRAVHTRGSVVAAEIVLRLAERYGTTNLAALLHRDGLRTSGGVEDWARTFAQTTYEDDLPEHLERAIAEFDNVHSREVEFHHG